MALPSLHGGGTPGRPASGDKAREAEFLKSAAVAERKLSYDEPPPWIIVSEGRYPAKAGTD